MQGREGWLSAVLFFLYWPILSNGKMIECKQKMRNDAPKFAGLKNFEYLCKRIGSYYLIRA